MVLNSCCREKVGVFPLMRFPGQFFSHTAYPAHFPACTDERICAEEGLAQHAVVPSPGARWTRGVTNLLSVLIIRWKE